MTKTTDLNRLRYLAGGAGLQLLDIERDCISGAAEEIDRLRAEREWRSLESVRRGVPVEVATLCGEIEIASFNGFFQQPWSNDLLVGVREPIAWRPCPPHPDTLKGLTIEVENEDAEKKLAVYMQTEGSVMSAKDDPAQTTEARLRQALSRVRSSLLSPVNEGAICDVLWMDAPCPETMIDFIDSELEAADAR